MSAIYTVSDGDDAVAADLNQLVNALNNNFGITDTSQPSLGRLVLPRSTASQIPGSPITAQTWFVTDEGIGGRLYVRHAADNVAYLPIRKFYRSSEIPSNVTISSTSLTDVTGLSVSVITSGGRLRIWLAPSDTGKNPGGAVTAFLTSSDGDVRGWVACVVGATKLSELPFVVGNGTSTADWEITLPPGCFMWDYKPATGAYTVKIQGRTGGSNMNLQFGQGLMLVVEEWGD